MGVELGVVKMLAVFLLCLAAAALALRLALRWRYAVVLGRARRIADRLRRPATTLAAVEEQSSAVEELTGFGDVCAAAAAARELLKENDTTVRSAAIEVLRETRALDMWSRDLQRGGYPAKLRAIQALGDVGDERALEQLLEALGQDDPDVARAASYAIVARDPDYAADRLAEALSSPDRRLAETAGATLVRMGEEAVEALVGQLTNPSTQARRLAVESLGSIGEPSVKKVLLPLLETDPEPEVRSAVAEVMARVDAEATAQDLQRLANSDPDWFVRARAFSLLAEANTPGAGEFLTEALLQLEPDLTELSEEGDVVECVIDGPRRVRTAIIAGLQLLGMTDEEIAAIERRTAALAADGGTRDPDDVSDALAGLRDRDPARRAEAAQRLGEVGLPAAPALALALRDPDPLVRAEAARALGRTGAPDSLRAIAECLRDPDPSVRLAASTALRAIVTREAAKEFTE